MKTFILCSLVAMLAGCPKDAVLPTPDADSGDADAAVAATCSNWCKHATSMTCAASAPTKAGASCVDVCTNVQTGSAPFNLRCRVSATSCAAADACER